MINPEGEIIYQYEKTISWFPSESDKIIDYIDTEYGRIVTAICFDIDFPAFINQAGRSNVDILLVPAFDTEVIKKHHGQTALFRGVEKGFSVVRQVQKGMCYSVDYIGNVVSFQDYIDTQEHLMYSDIPIKGVKTLYSYLGDWFIYVNIVGLIGFSIIKKYREISE